MNTNILIYIYYDTTNCDFAEMKLNKFCKTEIHKWYVVSKYLQHIKEREIWALLIVCHLIIYHYLVIWISFFLYWYLQSYIFDNYYVHRTFMKLLLDLCRCLKYLHKCGLSIESLLLVIQVLKIRQKWIKSSGGGKREVCKNFSTVFITDRNRSML